MEKEKHSFNRVIALFTICLLAIFQLHSQIDSELEEGLQAVLDNSVQFSGNNGVSAALILEDGTTWTGVSGKGVKAAEIREL